MSNVFRMNISENNYTDETVVCTFAGSTDGQDGDFDLYKFCKDCDGKVIGRYESYAREFFYAKELPKGKELIITDNFRLLKILKKKKLILKQIQEWIYKQALFLIIYRLVLIQSTKLRLKKMV